MSELVGDGAHEAFLWETASWGFVNSDNYSGGASEETPGKKATDLSPSNNNQMVTKENEAAGVAAVVVAGGSIKRGGGKRSENKGSGGEVNELGGKGGGGGGGGESDHEIHIWTERERRKKMRNMFSNLHALLPQLPPKVNNNNSWVA